MSSFFSKADLWDCKFPLCIILHVAMRDDIVREIHKGVAEVISRSVGHATRFTWPQVATDASHFLQVPGGTVLLAWSWLGARDCWPIWTMNLMGRPVL